MTRFCIIPVFTQNVSCQNMINSKNSLSPGLKALIITGILFFLVSCEKQQELPARIIDKPLVFIGIDGAEWGVMLPMLERGELPNIKKLMDAGVHTGLINPGAMVSPAVWSTFVTGEHPRAHGVLAHTFPFDDSKSKQPVNSTLRLKPALWNIASEAGLRSAVLGYYVSWPAEDIVGTIVTDRVMQKFPHSVFPDSLSKAVYKIVDELSDGDAQEEFLRRYYSWGYRPEQANNPNDPHHKAAKLIVWRGDRLLINDEVILRSTKALQANAYDLVVAYFRTTDLASHSFWREYDNSGFSTAVDPDLKAQLGDVIPEAYRYVDEAIGELVQQYGGNANYILVSDHGFRSIGKELILKNKKRSVITGDHLPVGVFIAAGPDIRKQSTLPVHFQATVLDIMPTMVRLLGLPVATEQRGKPLDWIFTGTFKQENALKTISFYPKDDFARPYNSADEVDDKKEMSSLSGLGYIGGEISEGEVTLQGFNFWNSSQGRIVEHIAGEIILELLAKRFPDAADIMLDLIANKPEFEELVLQLVRGRLKLISESSYISKPINYKRLVGMFKQELVKQQDSTATINGG